MPKLGAEVETVTTYDDGDWLRTAIVVPEKGASFDLITEEGERIVLINAFVYFDDEGKLDHVSVDVIDKDDKFSKREALTFINGQRNFLEANNLVCAYYRR